ncbi:Erp42 protein (plasmid) [Borreliella afzelii ACA-1]|uniref:hypothetical protein n=1 Tax=Borreliella afzelii TaxID=29518 RepID=UPI00016B3B4B|nr:Erp42 protein [Borreliella afzelii ACA-1]
MNKKMFIICAIFSLIISCKNYADSKQTIKRKVEQGLEIERKNKQELKKQVKGFLDTKERIVSDDPTVYEIAEKLKKEEELKGKKENKQEAEEELMQGDDPNSHSNMPALKTTQDSVGQQKEKEEQAKAEEVKVKEEKVEQAKAKAEQEKKEKEERERKEKEKQQQEQRKRQEEEKKKQEEQEKAKAEKERKEKEERQRQEQEERQIKSKIETLTKKIDEINRDIDSIKYKSWFVEDVKRARVRAQEVIDKVTGPIYDHFTDKSDAAIYYTWGLVDEDEDSELGDLLKKLSETRSNLRTKLNEGNQAATWNNTPSLKENVNVSEIESDLDKLRSKLEEVKGYLKNESNFEKIKEYVYSSDY